MLAHFTQCWWAEVPDYESLFLDEASGKYAIDGPLTEARTSERNRMYAQDAWEFRTQPDLTGGLRYEVQFPYRSFNQRLPRFLFPILSGFRTGKRIPARNIGLAEFRRLRGSDRVTTPITQTGTILLRVLALPGPRRSKMETSAFLW